MKMLEVNHLAVYFGQGQNIVKAVDDVSFVLNSGEILGMVGESGSGKTMTVSSILRLLPPTARVICGEAIFEGKDLLLLPEKRMEKIRGKKIAFIPQDPTGSLNPVVTVGAQIKEMFAYHRLDIAAKNREKAVKELLEQLRIPDVERAYSSFPHELSGGMNQRIIIAMALAVKPTCRLVIADEPTTALDVTVQKKILDDLISRVREYDLSLILITHNLGLIAEYADRVLVLKAGKTVEEGNVFDIFSNPKDSYTKHLLEVVPKIQELGGAI